MIRHFNYTSRRRIPRDRVSVVLKPGIPVPSFDASVDLSGLEISPGARVYVEAHFKSSLQRFDFGTVGNPSTPADRRLDEVDQGNAVFFAVKVVDTREAIGRLNAEVDDLSPQDGGGQSGRYCILPVNFVEMGECIWRLSFEGSRPTLEVNKWQGVEAFVKSNPVFTGLVYPEVVRQVLLSIVSDSDWEGGEGLSGWKETWIRFARSFTNENPPGADADEDAKDGWVATVVDGFCHRLKLKTHAVEALTEESR